MDANGATSSTAEVEIVPPEQKVTHLAPRAPSGPVRVTTPRALVLAQALEEEREQRELLKRYVTDFMIEGEDYGLIPGVKKRSLFKPGAEKLMDLFRCRPEYEVMAKEVNHESGLFYYEIRCRAVNRETDTVLNEGVGSASSFESKYRYRNASRVCPSCGKDTIIKGKAEYGGGWICYAKKGGCGAKWTDGAPEIEEQSVGKIQNPDLADVANVVLKMAKKRAQVDCAIALARVSDLFTQDVEDLPESDLGHEDAPSRATRQAPKQEAPRKAEAKPAPRQAAPPPAHVLALWNKTAALCGEANAKSRPQTRAMFEQAGHKVFGANPKPSNEWTVEDCKAVEAIIFPQDIVY